MRPYILKKYLLPPVMLLFLSCINGQLVKEKVWVKLKVVNSSPETQDIQSSLEILDKRSRAIAKGNPEISFDKDDNLITIQISGIKDTGLIKELLTQKGGFRILETLDNREASDRLFEINKHLKEVEEDSLFAWIEPVKFEYGSIVGFSRPEDTAKVNSILNRQDIKKMLPQNLLFTWGKYLNEGTAALHSVKRPSTYMPMDFNMVKDARPFLDHYGNYMVFIEFEEQFHPHWAKMTRENLGKSLAIVIDQKVYSAPVVNAEIQGGKAAISGDMNKQEAEVLSSVIKSGPLPLDLQIEKLGIK